MYSGYSNFFKDFKPVCTYCNDNTINDGSSSMLIDHVFIKGNIVESGKRVLTQKVQIKDTNHNLSDHFGLKVQLK